MMSDHGPMLSRRFLLAAAPALAVHQARAQTAGAPVRIGVLADRSGPYADNTGRVRLCRSEFQKLPTQHHSRGCMRPSPE